MFAFRSLNFFSLILLSFLLSACGGGGGGGGSSRDVFTAGPAVIDTSGPNSFLLFPNPLVLSNGTFQTDSTAYAQAYYAAIDPANQKGTWQHGCKPMALIVAQGRRLQSCSVINAIWVMDGE